MRFVVTGAAGFIGSNYVDRLLGRGDEVVAYDNLSRPGVEANLEWLKRRHDKASLQWVIADIRDAARFRAAAEGAEVIVHLAGQTAVTTSVADPRGDFESNALGTLNVLEAARLAKTPPVVVYASTNKVYGPMNDLPVVEKATRYAYGDPIPGVSEARPLDLYSPYGCSKGAGDQYARDYARIYGLRTVVLRQSCIYGPLQMGLEDQGWAAWFLLASLLGRRITVCGNGKQVRDMLYVDDLLDAYDAAIARIDRVAGNVYNIGGGPERTMSVWAEFSSLLERVTGTSLQAEYAGWRPGDQLIYVSDVRKARCDLEWEPKVGIEEGVGRLYDWILANRRSRG